MEVNQILGSPDWGLYSPSAMAMAIALARICAWGIKPMTMVFIAVLS